MQNISHLCSRKNSKNWGHDAWKKVSIKRYYHAMFTDEKHFQVVVVIISDGRKNVNPEVLDCLAALGTFARCNALLHDLIVFQAFTRTA